VKWEKGRRFVWRWSRIEKEGRKVQEEEKEAGAKPGKGEGGKLELDANLEAKH
jgi:hypothetical protein